MGLAISPDNKQVLCGRWPTKQSFHFDVQSGKKLGEINCNKTFDDEDYSDGYIGDMVMTRDGGRLYAVDQIGFRLITIDTKPKPLSTIQKQDAIHLALPLAR